MKDHPGFEQGPIRPPNEARSLLLRITRNCPWNQCLFCPVYKNRIDPHFIRLRSLRVPQRIPLYQNLIDGTFTPQTDDMFAEETRLLIETLDGIHSTITSDHIMNLLEEVSGSLPKDKNTMLDVIAKYQMLSDQDRLIFRAGRRGGAYHATDDLKNDPATYHKIKNLVADIRVKDGKEGVDAFISGLADRYI